MNKKIACIGARETPDEVLTEMFEIGVFLASKGYTIASGNAKGADEYFAKGANTIDSTSVKLYLPWRNLNQHLQVEGNQIEVWENRTDVDCFLAQVHRGWAKVKDYVRQLHRRNYGIIHNSLCVVCYTIDGTDRGGTGIGIRLAKLENIPVFNLYYESEKENFINYLSSLEEKTNDKL